MADLAELRTIVESAAWRGLDPTPVSEVRIEPSVGQDGEDVLRITVVIPDDRFDEVDGTQFVSALVNVRQDVRQQGEARETIVGYTTPSALKDDGGS